MPYSIKSIGKGHYKVVNAATGDVKARNTTLTKAKNQVKLLEILNGDGSKAAKHARIQRAMSRSA